MCMLILHLTDNDIYRHAVTIIRSSQFLQCIIRLEFIVIISIFQGTFEMCSEFSRDQDGMILFYKVNR